MLEFIGGPSSAFVDLERISVALNSSPTELPGFGADLPTKRRPVGIDYVA